MLTFIMIYLFIGMFFTALAMYYIGKEFGSYRKAIQHYNANDIDLLLFYYEHPKLIEWGSYILFTVAWPYFLFSKKV